jgi:hypothetical protein
MGRNNGDFEDAWFHVSDKANREGIEKEGLLPHNRHEGVQDDVPAGVYMSKGEPDPDYGDDVYQIHPHAGFDPLPDPMDDYPAHYVGHGIKTSDFKRVGHVFVTPDWHQEIHWHKEEDCNGAQ